MKNMRSLNHNEEKMRWKQNCLIRVACVAKQMNTLKLYANIFRRHIF